MLEVFAPTGDHEKLRGDRPRLGCAICGKTWQHEDLQKDRLTLREHNEAVAEMVVAQHRHSLEHSDAEHLAKQAESQGRDESGRPNGLPEWVEV